MSAEQPNERVLDMLQRMKAMGIGKVPHGWRNADNPVNAASFRRTTELRLKKLGIECGDGEFAATEYAVWLRYHPKFHCCYCRKKFRCHGGALIISSR